MLRTLPFHMAASSRRLITQAQISVVTPISPQPLGALILVSGTYQGSPNCITLVWRREGKNASAPVAVTSMEGGLWSATITAPATPGSYTLFAAFDGVAPIAEALPVTIQALAPGPVTLGTFGFEGTGLPANTIALFGHAFEQGTIEPTDPVLLRHVGTAVPLRTQINALSRWPDGSVKTALMAVELPALADGERFATKLSVGEVHPTPGTAQSFAALLTRRTAMVRTWAPGNTTTPLWSFDPFTAIGDDRWHEGPLAISTRIETPMPASANTEGRQSVRLIVDMIATKDGTLELDVCFSNDRLPYTSQNQTRGGFANCGPASFGYTIEIDGQIVYDQRPASGAATTLMQYSQWIRRRGRTSTGVTLGWASHRPFFRPDLALLVRSGVQQNYLTARPVDQTQIDVQIGHHLNAGATRETDPYWPWGLNRSAGAVGGRPEIGYRPFWGAVWLTEGPRNAQILSQRAFEAAATRAMYYRDWEDDEWINPVAWPRFTIARGAGTSPPGTPKHLAISTPQAPTHTQTNHITIDRAHHGAFSFLPALLSGRRLAYDSLAARVNWLVMMNNFRHVPRSEVPPLASPPPRWRGTVTPDHKTGVGWGPRFGAGQTRDAAWDMRCIVDAAAIMPDSWPSRTLYDHHVEAYFSAYAAQIPAVNARWAPDLGTPFFHANTPRAVNYMMHFVTPSLLTAQRCGIGGPSRDVFIENFCRARVGWITEPTFNHRNFQSGRSFTWTSEDGTQDAKTWAQVHSFTVNHSLLGDTPEDWTTNPGEGDYVRNANMTLINIAYALDVPLDIKAMAADAAVLCASERIRPETGVANRPVAEPQSYYRGNFQTNAVWPAGITSERDIAPVIPTGQSFPVPASTPADTVVGVVAVMGVLPRNSAPGRASSDAFAIVSQPAGNPLSVSGGGVLRVANPAALGREPFIVQLYCRTWEQRGLNDPKTEHRSATVAVTIMPVV